MRQLAIVRVAANALQAVRIDIRKRGLGTFLRRLPYYLLHWRRYVPVLTVRTVAADPQLFHSQAPVLREVRLHPELQPGEPQAIGATVSVVIPTLNAGPEFAWLLRKLAGQKAVGGVEIVVVDSGSNDGTVAMAREAGATVVEIPPSEFSHSHARNLGARHATGDYVLFMVQDAYPVGELWMHGMLAFLREHADDKLAAVSCAEYSRSDSDMMYDSMVDTHYRFLDCLEHDRIGEYRGDDHMSLRSLGQLSDVSCLISRELFDRYQYRGNYAEDLDLGIRLIKDGWRVAMLASVKTIHSHNRPAWYYLKRTFVDVIFLTGLFPDFGWPRCKSLPGLVAGMHAMAQATAALVQEPAAPHDTLALQLKDWTRRLKRTDVRAAAAAKPFPDARVQAFLARLQGNHPAAQPLSGAAADEADHFVDSYIGRLDHFRAYCERVYGAPDETLLEGLRAVACKTYAATAGALLAYHYLSNRDAQGPEGDAARALFDELVAGV